MASEQKMAAIAARSERAEYCCKCLCLELIIIAIGVMHCNVTDSLGAVLLITRPFKYSSLVSSIREPKQTIVVEVAYTVRLHQQACADYGRFNELMMMTSSG